jgi:hypothetical protein
MVEDDGEWMIRGNHSSSFIHQMDFGKMHIGPIFFPEIGFTISGKNRLNLGFVNGSQIGKEKSLRNFSFPK